MYIGDTDLVALGERQLTQLRRDKVGFIFQAYNLVPTLNALGEHHPSHGPRRPQARQGVARHTSSTPSGCATGSTHRPSELSGGQQQRVAVARALASRPEIIFADEPTGNLDSRAGAEILEFMRGRRGDLGQTIVMVTHDPVAAAYADRVLFLADGRIVDEMPRPDRRPRTRPHEALRGADALMLKLARKTVFAHKRRLIGTGLSVIIGIAFLAGDVRVHRHHQARPSTTSSPTSTATPTSYVRSNQSIEGDFGQTQRPRIPDSVIAQVAAVPGVTEAEGTVQGFARIIGKDGKPLGSEQGPPTFGGVLEHRDAVALDDRRGPGPQRRNEVVIDREQRSRTASSPSATRSRS